MRMVASEPGKFPNLNNLVLLAGDSGLTTLDIGKASKVKGAQLQSYFATDSDIVVLLSGADELKLEKLHYRIIPSPGGSEAPGEIEQTVNRAEQHRYILHFDFTGDLRQVHKIDDPFERSVVAGFSSGKLLLGGMPVGGKAQWAIADSDGTVRSVITLPGETGLREHAARSFKPNGSARSTGLAYLGRQYGREIGQLFGASTGAVSRVPVLGAAPAMILEIFDGCGMEGDAHSPGVRALDRLKNRYTAPSARQIDSAITLEAILASGNDISRWKVKEGAEIVGYVSNVKRGGIESTNCRARDDTDRDTHIELVLDPRHNSGPASMIVEVTPRWRDIMRERGTDWSTRGLRDRFLGRWVEVRGWMLFDAEHPVVKS